jgi:phage tail-like protein
MPSRGNQPLLRASAFEVRVGGREIGFAHVGPLTSETASDNATGGSAHRFAPVVLRRAVTSSSELYEWRRAIVDGKDDRRDVTIRQLSAPGGTPVNAWRLVRAWPSRWAGPTFDAMTDEIASEEVELTFDDLLWLTTETSQGG